MPGGSEIFVILLVVALIFVVPMLRKQAVQLVDEQALGAKELARIRENHPVRTCESTVVNEVLDRFRQRLRLRLPGVRALTVEREGLNAAALPDGTVVLWEGVVQAVDQGLISKDELAGLLAHELAHMELDHGRQRALQELMAGPLVGRLAGRLGGPVGQVALGKGVDLLRKGASREAELEADALALAFMKRAGFAPEGLERFLGRLADMGPTEPRWAAWLSTHPHLQHRREVLRELRTRP